jgi:hypothetical protein
VKKFAGGDDACLIEGANKKFSASSRLTLFWRGHDEKFVNAMFTTFMRARFTNVFDDSARIAARPCVWRACIAD